MRNIYCITRNFLDSNFDVIVDWIVFPNEAVELVHKLWTKELEAKYVILMTNQKALVARDASREDRMSERALELLAEFQKITGFEKHFVDTSSRSIEETVGEIMNSEKFILRN